MIPSNESFPPSDLSASELALRDRLIASAKDPAAALAAALEAVSRKADAAADAAILALFENQTDEGDGRAELLAAACEQASETLDGQRLCVCLTLVNLGAGEDFRVLPAPLITALRAQGFSPDERLLSIPEAQAMSFEALHKTHLNALGQPQRLRAAGPLPRAKGLQLRALIASLPGPDRGDWEALDSERQSFALATLMDLVNQGWPEGSAVALAAAPFGSALRQSDAVGCPIALRSLVESCCSVTRGSPRDLAAVCSLHDQRVFEGPFWRVSIRAKESGFLLGGMDWPLSGMSAESAFYDGMILELASLGVDECYHIDGAYDDLNCPDCGDPIYPSPDIPAWREAAIEAGLNPSGEHQH